MIMALSPRTPAPRLQSGSYGTAGRAAPAPQPNPTAGRPVAGTPRRAVVQDDPRTGRPRTRTVTVNTMSRTRMQSGIRRRPATGEFTKETLTHVGVPPLARVNPGQRPGPGYVDPETGIITEAAMRLAGEAESIRQSAMQKRSVLTVNGAVAMSGRSTPVWEGDAEQAAAWALIMALAGE